MSANLYFQCLMGVACNDFTMLVGDKTTLQSIIVMDNDTEKLFTLQDGLVMGVNGEPGDIMQFIHYVKQNLLLYRMRNRYSLGTEAAVHFTRRTLSDTLRTGSPYLVNLLVGGYDKSQGGGMLYSLDFMASCVKVPFASHGFGGMLSSGILQEYHSKKLTERQAYEVMKLCVHEINQRLFTNLPQFQVKVVDKHGASSLAAITPDIAKLAAAM